MKSAKLTKRKAIIYYPHGGSANPVKTVLALASLAQRQGATMLTHHEVTGIAHLDDGTYQVVTAPTLVLAGRSLGIMLDLSVPVNAVRGQMWTTASVPSAFFIVKKHLRRTSTGTATPTAMTIACIAVLTS